MNRLVLALALAALFITAGVMSLYAGVPKDVSDLKNHPGGKVRVSGVLLNYGVEGDSLYLLLAGRDGFTIRAVVPYLEVVRVAGANFQFDREVVLEGYYDPAARRLNVTTILKGCHSAYYAPTK